LAGEVVRDGHYFSESDEHPSLHRDGLDSTLLGEVDGGVFNYLSVFIGLGSPIRSIIVRLEDVDRVEVATRRA
jgi:hypothetical protein